MARSSLVVTVLIGMLCFSSFVLAESHEDFREPVDGVIGAVARNFVPANRSVIGVLEIGVAVAEFEDDAAAGGAFEILPQRHMSAIETLAEERGISIDMSGLRPASIPTIGDMSFLQAGQIVIDGFNLNSVLVVVQQGTSVFFATGLAIGVDPLNDVLPAVEDMLPRAQGAILSEGDSHATDGTRSDELWAILPTVLEMPVGFVVKDELIPGLFVGLERSTVATPASF